jgi:hypothetical protein
VFPFEEVFRKLNEADVRYVVVGGVAVVLHGVMRLTSSPSRRSISRLAMQDIDARKISSS